jgi:DNA-binding NarL/FixJ family response regulator
LEAQENTQRRHDILILDPDVEFAGLVAQAIRDVDGTYRVTVDSDAQNVLVMVQGARAAQHPLDLLIADVNTLGSTSMRVIEELVQSCPELKIVTMTAFHSPELLKHLQQLNVCAHLVKPVLPSEIRQSVQDALAGRDLDAGRGSPALPLDGAQRSAVERLLGELRGATHATAALLVHASGGIQAINAMDSDMDASTLGLALMDAQRSVSRSLAQAMDISTPIRQCFFGTDSYSVCFHRVDGTYAVATIFGPDVREGQMWFAMRGAIGALQEALSARGQGARRRSLSGRGEERGRAGNEGFDMVADYFDRIDSINPNSPQNPLAPARSTAGIDTVPPKPEMPSEMPIAEPTTVAPEMDLTLPPALEMERLEMEKVDWDLDSNQEWDALVSDTGQAFQGLSFDEAKKRGILGDLETDD